MTGLVPGAARRTARAQVALAARDRLQRVLRPFGDPAADPVEPAVSEGEALAPADEVLAAPRATRWRVDPTRRGALALAGLAALSILATAALVWRAQPRPVVVPPPVVTPSRGASTGTVVVDVQGAVRTPGLVTLAVGSRVADALAAAGGLRPGASTVGLNLARRLADGEQVVVAAPGTTAPPAAARAGTAPGAGTRLDLNLATLEQLDALPGIGPVTARRILDWRAEHGRFASVDQLREVEGIGAKRFESLRDLVTV